METLIHADIFFFITSIWVIVISAIVAIILVYVAFIFNDLRHISRKMRQGSEALAEDLNEWEQTSTQKDLNYKAYLNFSNIYFPSEEVIKSKIHD